MTNEEKLDWLCRLRSKMPIYMPKEIVNNEMYEALDTVIKAIEQEPCEDAISRQAALKEFEDDQYSLDYCMDAAINEWRGELNKAIEKALEKHSCWIPVSERLPELKKDCIVCAKGNVQGYSWDDWKYEILTGCFSQMEDDDTKETVLVFQFDRYTLFLPDEWELLPLDDKFRCHMDKGDCTYYTDESCTDTEYHDRYVEILAWMPLPKHYEPQERSGKG